MMPAKKLRLINYLYQAEPVKNIELCALGQVSTSKLCRHNTTARGRDLFAPSN